MKERVLRIVPVAKQPAKPAPGTVVVSASEVARSWKRIEARLCMLPGLLDDRMDRHLAEMRRLKEAERVARRRRGGLDDE